MFINRKSRNSGHTFFSFTKIASDRIVLSSLVVYYSIAKKDQIVKTHYDATLYSSECQVLLLQ